MTTASSFFGKDYAYGYGRVGVLQEYLLSQSDVEEMIAARDERHLSHMITELKLSSRTEYAADPHVFINNLEKWLQQEIRSMAARGDERIFDILWLRSDASLIAYLLKRHHGFTSAISKEPHVGATAFDPEDLRNQAAGRPVTALPKEVSAFIMEMREEQGISPQEIDTRTAQFIADLQMSLAKQSGSEHIRRYTAHHIDLQNIRTARRLPKNEDPGRHLLRGGDIDITRFSLEAVHLAELVRGSSLPNTLAEDLLTSDDSSVVLERGLAKAIAHDIAVMSRQILTIEPIFAFAAIAQSQLRLLRTIIIGKSTRLSPDEIRNLLPPFLSASPFAS